MITVEKTREGTFHVTVEESGSTSEHTVTVGEDYYEELTGGAIPEDELVRRSFDFLLDRESKESILSSFDLRIISHYFPEYERTIKQAL
ncbi:MAG: hypothetical protein ACOC8E_07370 [Planctomycetota bacterium]